MLALAVVLLAGLLILDAALEVWRLREGVERGRRRDRDRAQMLRTLDRTGGRR